MNKRLKEWARFSAQRQYLWDQTKQSHNSSLLAKRCFCKILQKKLHASFISMSSQNFFPVLHIIALHINIIHLSCLVLGRVQILVVKMWQMGWPISIFRARATLSRKLRLSPENQNSKWNLSIKVTYKFLKFLMQYFVYFFFFFFFFIHPPPGLLPVLGPQKWYMTLHLTRPCCL